MRIRVYTGKTGVTDLLIYLRDPNNTAVLTGSVMTESGYGWYYYDYSESTSGVFTGYAISASMQNRTFTIREDSTSNSSSGSASATYTTNAKVAAFLGLPAFSANTIPTDSQVDAFIYRSQDYIDMRTKHAWRSTTVTDEYYDNKEVYEDGFLKVYLNHRKIRTLATGSGDKLEVWNGSSWEDWVAAGSGKTEGRANDFWVDYTNGILFINVSGSYVSNALRMTYRYGDSTVPFDIEQAATLLTAIDVTLATQRTSARPDESDNSTIYIWRRQIESILTNRAEVRMIL